MAHIPPPLSFFTDKTDVCSYATTNSVLSGCRNAASSSPDFFPAANQQLSSVNQQATEQNSQQKTLSIITQHLSSPNAHASQPTPPSLRKRIGIERILTSGSRLSMRRFSAGNQTSTLLLFPSASPPRNASQPTTPAQLQEKTLQKTGKSQVFNFPITPQTASPLILESPTFSSAMFSSSTSSASSSATTSSAPLSSKSLSISTSGMPAAYSSSPFNRATRRIIHIKSQSLCITSPFTLSPLSDASQQASPTTSNASPAIQEQEIESQDPAPILNSTQRTPPKQKPIFLTPLKIQTAAVQTLANTTTTSGSNECKGIAVDVKKEDL